jgi:hypothetical protein
VFDELIDRLRRVGLRVCVDLADFRLGVPVLINIEDAVADSRHALLVVTPAWLASEWNEFESLLVGTADPSGRRRKLMPLLLTERAALPDRLAALTVADFTPSVDHDEAFERLVGQIHRAAPVAPPALPPAFVVGPPITHPRRFFGRHREVKRIFQLLRHAPLQNAAIIGRPRSGKTSLLLHIQRLASAPVGDLRPGQRVPAVPDVAPRFVFVDFQDPRVGTRHGLLSYLLKALDLACPRPCCLDDFMDIASRQLRSPTVVLLDELAVALERYPELDHAFWEGLRSLASNHTNGNLGFVLSTHRPLHELPRSCASSPFFNIFGFTASLGPLQLAEAQEFVRSAPLPIDPDDEAFILHESGCWPLLLQILCRECVLAREDGEAGPDWRVEAEQQIAPFAHLLRPGIE